MEDTRKSATVPAYEGQVFTNGDGHVVKKTLLYAGKELDPDGPDLYRFIAWQGDLIYRTRLTAGEIERLALVEVPKGLDHYQKGAVARMLFRHWESDERRSVEMHRLTEASARLRDEAAQ